MTSELKPIFNDNSYKRIIHQLLYYDIFDHLLTEDELIRDCALEGEQHRYLKELAEKGIIYKFNGYYSIRNRPDLVEKRNIGINFTKKSMPRALKMARLISRFPFVRAVSLSGSISKGYMDSYKDIDYFIIARPGRLWLARTLLVVYKKIFLLNSFRYFCLNYFIDDHNLLIRDRNIFTATEINTLIPVYGDELFQAFFKANDWVKAFYPNYPKHAGFNSNETNEPAVKLILEKSLSNFIGTWLDILSMKFTILYWRWKFRGKKSYLFASSFRLNREEAKYHPGDFQQMVIKKYQMKQDWYEKELKISLADGK